jgi:hypothetical protein
MPVFHYQRNINLGTTAINGSLQAAYNLSAPANITLDSANGTLTIIDAAASLGDLFIVQDNTLTNVFQVESTGDTTATGVLLSSNVKRGTGDPNGVVTGSRGDAFQRTDGAAGNDILYACQGGTVWSAMTPSPTITFLNEILAIGAPVLSGFPLGSLSMTPIQVASLHLTINGMSQTRTVDYTISGAVITWTGAYTLQTTDCVVAYYV